MDADLINKFPLGCDMREMIKLFEQSGARCKDISDKKEDLPNDMKEYDIIYQCKYSSDWLSFDPLGGYIIWFMGDKFYIGGAKTPKLVT